MLVALLLGALLLREPRFAQVEDRFLGWLLRHSHVQSGPAVPLTVVEIARSSLTDATRDDKAAAAPQSASAVAISPLEFALFLQSVLEFQPQVIAFENILKWRERDKDQEQVFLDQAMRVPRLLLAAELGDNSDPDAPWADIRGITQVTGRRGDLAPFAGVARQPNEDLRLIAQQGFINLPEEASSSVRVPLLFLYRGEVIPSFPLQAILLWLRVTPAEVKVDLGKEIVLPQNRRIPIARDGTLLIDPNMAKRARRIGLNELLLAAQQRESGHPEAQEYADIRDHLVLARTPENPLSPPDVFAATIATIQAGAYLHRVSRLFDFLVLLVIAGLWPFFRRIDRIDLFLLGIAVTAAYCLASMGTIATWHLWLPGVLPLGALWLAIAAAFFFRAPAEAAREASIPPPLA